MEDLVERNGVIEHLGENLRNHTVAGGEEITAFGFCGEIFGEFLGGGIFREKTEDVGREEIVDMIRTFRGNGGEKASGKDKQNGGDAGEGEEEPAGGGMFEKEEVGGAENGSD